MIILFPSKFKQRTSYYYQYILKLLNLKILFISSLLGTLSWLCEGLSFWIILKGLNISNVSFGFASIAHNGASLIGAISLIPGGLGANEAGTVGLLSMRDIPLKISITSTILIRLMTLWFATFLGIVCLLIPFKKKVLNNEN